MEWREFEKKAAKSLTNKLKKLKVKVIPLGKEDSTKPDIIITDKKKLFSFFVEVKMPKAQTSQFVLEIANGKFVYSNKNNFKSNFFSDSIIDYMNQNFEIYNKVAQTGIEIPVSKTLINGWIVSNLKNKGINYVFTVTEKEEEIFNIDLFEKYFNATAYFRRKKSGSANLSVKRETDFINSFEKKYGYKPNLIKTNKKVFIKLNDQVDKQNRYIPSVSDNTNYFLSFKTNNTYEVKILSNTNNPNVIFQLSINKNIEVTNDLNMFYNLVFEKLREEEK